MLGRASCRAFGVALLAYALCVAALGCASSDDAHPPAPPDCDGAACNPHPSGGGPGGGTTGGGGTGGGTGSPDSGDLDATVPPGDAGDAGTIAISYTVKQTVDSWFFATASYAGAVTVRAVGANGQLSPADDAGTALPGTLTDVAPGSNWFFVDDATPSRRITSTLQRLNVDARTATADLRAITTDGLANLIVDQVLWVPPAGTATVILSFRKGGKGVSGVTVKRDALPAGTTVAYDSNGMYVSDSMVLGASPATDVEGTAIVREIAGTQPFPALTSATLRYQLANSTAMFPIDVKLARDAVTWMQIDLP